VAKKIIALLVIVILLVSAIFVTVFIVKSFDDESKAKPQNIEIGIKYYMNGMNTGMYQYLSHETSMPSGEYIEFTPQDSSYCIFESKQIFRINFMHAQDPTEFRFIVTKFKQGKNGLKATIKHIYNGNVYSDDIETTSTEIVFNSPVGYDVNVASEGDSERINVVWNDAKMMTFLISKPLYITEASL
jgi:hypothetical protein